MSEDVKLNILKAPFFSFFLCLQMLQALELVMPAPSLSHQWIVVPLWFTVQKEKQTEKDFFSLLKVGKRWTWSAFQTTGQV